MDVERSRLLCISASKTANVEAMGRPRNFSFFGEWVQRMDEWSGSQ